MPNGSIPKPSVEACIFLGNQLPYLSGDLLCRVLGRLDSFGPDQLDDLAGEELTNGLGVLGSWIPDQLEGLEGSLAMRLLSKNWNKCKYIYSNTKNAAL